ncbi:tail fiber domain-containing protein [Winogradskyella sp. R77965]|uniref:tail fiber domain-containing protein n=1 Tax=Winogradskyella sp. R77965 TaxID=3093872 RepID=UPI0037DC490A
MKTSRTQGIQKLFRKISSLFLLLVFALSTINAQSPQKMTYQSVVRDASDNLITNSLIGIQVSILQGSANGTNVYTESYNPTPETNLNGLVTIAIGEGTPSTGIFTDIDWANGPYFLRVRIDPLGGTNYTITGTSQLLSVPYALYAETSGDSNTNDTWSTSGNAGTNSNIDFIGTTDNEPLSFKVNNVSVGELDPINDNLYFGRRLIINPINGESNLAIGHNALAANISGDNNTAIGYDAQIPNSSDSNQVRIGNTDVTYAGIQVAWTITSDAKWKENIRALPYGLDLVSQLKPVDYVRKNNNAKTREIGFVAQDVENLLTKIGYSDQGLLSKDDSGNLSLRYNDLIPLLTKAIQDLTARIEMLEQQ